MIINELFQSQINSPLREIKGRVELLDGSTLLNIFTYDGDLQSFVIERTGANDKFFGYGICQKATIKLRDKERKIKIEKNQGLQVAYGVENDYIYPNPIFYIDEITRDENTNDLTITAYDAIYRASGHKVNELELPGTYTLKTFIAASAALLGMPVGFENIDNYFLNLSYSDNANFDGTETIREALDDAAEVMGAIYYMNKDWQLIFKRLDKTGNPVLAIDKSKYFTLTAKTAHTLQNIVSATELGDNIIASSGIENGETQYLRDNAFLTLRTDIGTVLNNALARNGGLTIQPFALKWRGNFLVEIGDKISLTTKDNDTIISYMLNDKITYGGSISEETDWSYKASEGETAANPSTLGDALKQTFAKVDKVNQTIEMVVNEVDGYDSRLAALELNTDSISASVQQVQKNTDNRLDALGSEIDTLTNRVEATMTPEAVEIRIQEAMSDGVNQVTTETGFTFNDVGLTVSKSGSEMTTTITEDGMKVYKSGTEMLTADNTGVKAVNLHATTYLHIGTYSRFQDYEGRTGCFWIV